MIGAGLFALGLLVGSRYLNRESEPAAEAASTSRTPAPEEVARRQAEQAEALARGEHQEPDPQVPSDPLEPTEGPQEMVSSTGVEVVDGSDTASSTGRIAIVIDDLGRSLTDLERLDALGIPISFSVLPFEILTPEVVAEISKQGWEMLCHLPMEPQSGANPGPGALTSEMGPRQLRKATRRALEAVPGVVGVNNHMGSSLSADAPSMDAVLDAVGRAGLFWVDSRTSAESVGYRLALEKGIPAAERQVFLDPDATPEGVNLQFDRLLGIATERGAAIAIGHPFEVTIEMLAARIPEAQALGFEFVPVSYLLDRSVVSPQ